MLIKTKGSPFGFYLNRIYCTTAYRRYNARVRTTVPISNIAILGLAYFE